MNKDIEVWVCTDPDTKQFGRKISNGIYEFRETVKLPWEKEERENKLTIDIKEYSLEEIESTLTSFGYSLHPFSDKYIYNQYDDDDAEFLIAECLFEFELPANLTK